MKTKIQSTFIIAFFLIAISGCSEATQLTYKLPDSVISAQFSAPSMELYANIKLEPLGKDITIHTEKQLEFLADNTPNDRAPGFANGKADLSQPMAVSFSWRLDTNISETMFQGYTFILSENQDMSHPIISVDLTQNSYQAINLKAASTYYWQVMANFTAMSYKSTIESFTTEKVFPRMLLVPGATNVRDIGGYKTTDGHHIKQGLLYRGSKLTADNTGKPLVSDEGIKILHHDCMIKTEIDLRGNSNTENGQITESIIGSDVKYEYCPIDFNAGIFDSKNYASYRKIFSILADKNNYPVYFHCSIGTDRAGWLAYVLQTMATVAKKDAYKDYLLSSYGKIGRFRKLKDGPLLWQKDLDTYEGSTVGEQWRNFLINTVGVSSTDIDSVMSIIKK